MLLADIAGVHFHWSESGLLNSELGKNSDSDIETEVDAVRANELIVKAAKLVKGGYDKTVLTIRLVNGRVFCNEIKFYITRKTAGLLDLIGEEVITVSQDGG
jgi:hypothetical protein